MFTLTQQTRCHPGPVLSSASLFGTPGHRAEGSWLHGSLTKTHWEKTKNPASLPGTETPASALGFLSNRVTAPGVGSPAATSSSTTRGAIASEELPFPTKEAQS